MSTTIYHAGPVLNYDEGWLIDGDPAPDPQTTADAVNGNGSLVQFQSDISGDSIAALEFNLVLKAGQTAIPVNASVAALTFNFHHYCSNTGGTTQIQQDTVVGLALGPATDVSRSDEAGEGNAAIAYTNFSVSKAILESCYCHLIIRNLSGSGTGGFKNFSATVTYSSPASNMVAQLMVLGIL